MAPIHAKWGLPPLSIWKSYLLPPLAIDNVIINGSIVCLQMSKRYIRNKVEVTMECQSQILSLRKSISWHF